MNEKENNFLHEINEEIGTLMGKEPPASDLLYTSRRGQRESQYKFRLSKKAVRWIIALVIIFGLVGAGAGAYSAMQTLGRQTLMEHIAVDGVEITGPEGAVISNGGDTIYWNGRTYTKKPSIVNILCMGIDKSESERANAESLTYGEQGQADTLFLAVIDYDTGELTLVNLSRDSMIGVDVYNVDGEFVGTQDMQICLAYAYGDGGDESCLNEVKSVTRLMYGVPVDAYLSLDMPAINILNDAIGGVEVDVLEDLSSYDPTLTVGSHVLLKGNQAEIYVRSRNSSLLESNNMRMSRQRQYVTAYIRKAFTAIRSDWSVALQLYQTARTYSNVSFTLPQILYLVSVTLGTDFTSRSIVSIPGDVVMGEKNAEFYVDEEALFETIINTYYQEVA